MRIEQCKDRTLFYAFKQLGITDKDLGYLAIIDMDNKQGHSSYHTSLCIQKLAECLSNNHQILSICP